MVSEEVSGNAVDSDDSLVERKLDISFQLGATSIANYMKIVSLRCRIKTCEELAIISDDDQPHRRSAAPVDNTLNCDML